MIATANRLQLRQSSYLWVAMFTIDDQPYQCIAVGKTDKILIDNLKNIHFPWNGFQFFFSTSIMG